MLSICFMVKVFVWQRNLLFRDTVLSVSRHHIPAGRHCFFVPALNDETKKLGQQRDNVRLANPSDPLINDSNREIMSKTAKEKEKKWREFLQTLSHHVHLASSAKSSDC